MRRFLLIAFTTAVLTLAQLLPISQIFNPALSQALSDGIVLRAKPAVVRVTSGCYGYVNYSYGENEKIFNAFTYGVSGSGFFINPDGYIVTYAVIDSNGCKERLRENMFLDLTENFDYYGFKEPPGEDEKGNIQVSQASGEFKYYNSVILPHEDAEPYLFTIKTAGESLVEQVDQTFVGGDDVAVIKINVENAPTLKLGDFKEVERDDITVIGYSTLTDQENLDKVLSDSSFNEASVSRGQVSNANKTLADLTRILELSVSTTYGSAGSSVLNENGEVIGMVAVEKADRNPYIRVAKDEYILRPRGVPYALPSSKLREFIRDSGVDIDNVQGETDRLYNEGLESFFNKDYETAKLKFEAVKQSFPYHSEIDRLIIKSNEELIVTRNKTDFLLWGAIAAAVLAILGLAFFLLRRNRSGSGNIAGRGGDTGYNNFTSTSVPSPSPSSYNGANGVSSQALLELEFQGQFRRLPLQKEEHRLGCDSGWADFVIPETWKMVSGHHAILRREGNSYRIYDGDGIKPSTNGILTENGTRIDAQGHFLKHGDRLKIGRDPRDQVSIVYFNPNVGQSNVRKTEAAQ